MKHHRRASLLLAATLLLVPFSIPAVISFAGAEIRSDGDTAWQDAGTLERLAEVLEQWLDRNSPYPRNGNPVTIRQVAPAQVSRLTTRPSRTGLMPRGYYDPDSAEILLVAPWSLHDAHDVSVLLHELVHHRQQVAGHWYCPGAQELPAYRLQDKWLAERRLAARVNWIAVILESGCARRDIHPE